MKKITKTSMTLSEKAFTNHYNLIEKLVDKIV